MLRTPVLLVVALLAVPTGAPSNGSTIAVANDQRVPAGRLVDGEWHVALEAVEATWFPRGASGPAVVTPAFREAGGTPSVPGPLLRFVAGTPVRVAVTNRLDRAIHVRGLVDRDASRPPPQPGVPAFFADPPLELAPGETATVRFTPTEAVTSFYYARLVPDDGDPGAFPTTLPGGTSEEGAFMGAFVVDAPGDEPPHPDERVFMITRWGSPAEPGTLTTTWKMMVNGRSWPHTERIELTVGDTARWRIINASAVDHPMHLHGFFFDVEATGDTHADTTFVAGERREVVTEMMQEFSTLRLSWTPTEPGNWLFHCHLIRHMGELQRFEAERQADGGRSVGAEEQALHEMDGMAGLITGITVHPAPGQRVADPEPVRRLDLWTGARPGVFDDAPELGFVVQAGGVPPAADSVRVPGSPLVLTRGEPTEIVVHNRLDFPLSVHWHGLELRSLYDGVGHWSGEPGGVRPPIAPGDSQRVVIAPPRAGTFFYHTHGEPGHELSQGLYGPFLVLEPGARFDPEHDRVFTLGSRGADIDAAPAVNGRTVPDAERFEAGVPHRLRFIHISADEHKVVRLTRDGETVSWRPLAKDGADLPASRQAPGPAAFEIGVGESYDFEWTPERDGAYVLEVRTLYYPSLGGEVVQRVPFGVGAVTDDELRIAATGTDLPTVELGPAERARYVGAYEGTLLPDPTAPPFVVAVWEVDGRLHSSLAPRGAPDDRDDYLIPLGEGRFTPGRWVDGLAAPVDRAIVYDFGESAVPAEALRITQGGEPVFDLHRVPSPTLDAGWLDALAGAYRDPATPGDIVVERSNDAAGPPLVLRRPDGITVDLAPISATRFLAAGPDAPPGLTFVFVWTEGRVTGLRVLGGGGVLAELQRAR